MFGQEVCQLLLFRRGAAVQFDTWQGQEPDSDRDGDVCRTHTLSETGGMSDATLAVADPPLLT